MGVRRVLVTGLFAAGVVAVVVGLLVQVHGERAGRDRSSPVAVRPVAAEARARDVLGEWDRSRAAAWETGGPRALAALYLPGSRAGTSDVRALRRYRQRGLRVTGLRTQVLAWRVLDVGPQRVVVRLTDRVVGGVAVGPGGRTRLPADRPSTRTLTLVRHEGRWVMARVIAR
jgi:hypothetical protein